MVFVMASYLPWYICFSLSPIARLASVLGVVARSPYHLGAQGSMRVIDAGLKPVAVGQGRCESTRLLHFAAAHRAYSVAVLLYCMAFGRVVMRHVSVPEKIGDLVLTGACVL